MPESKYQIQRNIA